MKIKLRKRKEKKLIGNKTKQYIILGIIACCLAIGLNIHPSNKTSSLYSQDMIYVFHDYERNSYILNNSFHGSADELYYLFNDTTPENLKGANKTNTISLENSEINDTYNNQISIEEIMNELGIDSEYSGNIFIIDNSNTGFNENTLTIDLKNYGKNESQSENLDTYSIEQEGPTLTITKFKNFTTLKNKGNFADNDGKRYETIKNFQTIAESWILPSLTPLSQLENFDEISSTTSNENDVESNYNTNNYTEDEENYKIIGGITILPDYSDCMTPWGYKISHGESVLAYKQMDNAPNICNIERRFCWNGKLSGTYPQQGCSVQGSYYSYTKETSNITNTNNTTNSYTNNIKTQERLDVNENPTIKFETKQNKDGSVTVYKPETQGSFVFDRPNNASTDFIRGDDNIKTKKAIEQTEREHQSCITPRGEEVQHDQLVQAFKHANGFYDIPCETQIRLCSMGKLDGSYKQKSCKNWEYSFSSRFNGGANKDKYYKKRLEEIKQKIEDEETYYNDIKGLSEEEALDKIFYRLDE